MVAALHDGEPLSDAIKLLEDTHSRTRAAMCLLQERYASYEW